LYRLLANPEYLEPLREEVNAVIKEEGWTKAGVDKMHKIDSFLRETLRLDGLTICPLDPFSTPNTRYWCGRPFFLVSMGYLALRPLKLSNGMTIPAGTLAAIPSSATHRDEITYPNPDKFDGFRFAKLHDGEGDTMTNKYQTVSTSTENVAFGLGRHTW
jgi:cytochrome P450